MCAVSARDDGHGSGWFEWIQFRLGFRWRGLRVLEGHHPPPARIHFLRVWRRLQSVIRFFNTETTARNHVTYLFPSHNFFRLSLPLFLAMLQYPVISSFQKCLQEQLSSEFHLFIHFLEFFHPLFKLQFFSSISSYHSLLSCTKIFHFSFKISYTLLNLCFSIFFSFLTIILILSNYVIQILSFSKSYNLDFCARWKRYPNFLLVNFFLHCKL